MAELYLPGRRRFIAGEQLDERGLARAIDADQGHAVSPLDGELDVVEHVLRAITLREPLSLGYHPPRRRRLRKLEVDDWLFFGYLDALDLL